MKYITTLSLDIGDITQGISKDDLMEMILEIDKKQAETDFTLKLINQLVHSLGDDLSRAEIANELGFAA